jgi:hypothetical protein
MPTDRSSGGPYRHDDPAALQPARTHVKCGWAAGVFAGSFTNTILGIGVDVPADQVGLRPFSPWNEFTWTNCRLGSSAFNFSYRKEKSAATAEIESLNKAAFEAFIELLLPSAGRVLACNVNGNARTNHTIISGHRGSAIKIVEPVQPAGRFRVEVTYEG